jgi:DNA-directed RNA polymerase specialized sigma24 family protein
MAEHEEPRVASTEDHRRDPERRFAALYQAYYRPIMAYAVRRVAPVEDAADVFTTAWRRIGELPEAPADRLWLYGVAQRVIAGRRRSARRLFRLTARLQADAGTWSLSQPGPGQHGPGQRGPGQRGPGQQEPGQQEPGQQEPGQQGPGQQGPGQPGLRDAISDRVVAALDRLSVREREALQLVLWEELSHAEAARCSAARPTRWRSAYTGPRPGCAANCPPPNCPLLNRPPPNALAASPPPNALAASAAPSALAPSALTPSALASSALAPRCLAPGRPRRPPPPTPG